MPSHIILASASAAPELVDREWVAFPGGELEGKRPKVLCDACKRRLALSRGHLSSAAARPQAVCFQCYRTELERDRALRRAGQLDTATEARFQCTLPFEPVNRARLDHLRVERAQVRAAARTGAGVYAGRRTRAQIAARRAIERASTGIQGGPATAARRETRAFDAAAHAAELQLPSAWLPFVMGAQM